MLGEGGRRWGEREWRGLGICWGVGGGVLRGELNFVNGVFLRASHSALKAKPPG